jgi:hypothetical protein
MAELERLQRDVSDAAAFDLEHLLFMDAGALRGHL